MMLVFILIWSTEFLRGHCQNCSGEVLDHHCADCPPGEYYSVYQYQCVKCPIGTYKEATGNRSSCIACPIYSRATAEGSSKCQTVCEYANPCRVSTVCLFSYSQGTHVCAACSNGTCALAEAVSTSDDLAIGLGVGFGVGLAVLLIAIITIVLCCLRSRSQGNSNAFGAEYQNEPIYSTVNKDSGIIYNHIDKEEPEPPSRQVVTILLGDDTGMVDQNSRGNKDYVNVVSTDAAASTNTGFDDVRLLNGNNNDAKTIMHNPLVGVTPPVKEKKKVKKNKEKKHELKAKDSRRLRWKKKRQEEVGTGFDMPNLRMTYTPAGTEEFRVATSRAEAEQGRKADKKVSFDTQRNIVHSIQHDTMSSAPSSHTYMDIDELPVSPKHRASTSQLLSTGDWP